MTPVGMAPAKLTPSQQVKPQAKPTEADANPAPLKVEQNKVTLSEEGKALLAALQEIEKESAEGAKAEKSVGEKVESFAAGALGMDHPDVVKEEEDDSYTAGQFVSAAATIGGILLMLA
ncbi:hypothetical protein [Vibrio taketomensis]|uniref:hypothetical protein n=1 Tax=Vibrio taketomensis TaxID=2572923 RepID=UPI0013898F84|nr:hypothetical protein [Vibrio taketomensis]